MALNERLFAADLAGGHSAAKKMKDRAAMLRVLTVVNADGSLGLLTQASAGPEPTFIGSSLRPEVMTGPATTCGS